MIQELLGIFDAPAMCSTILPGDSMGGYGIKLKIADPLRSHMTRFWQSKWRVKERGAHVKELSS